jgi:hypothetical protein
MAVIDLIAENRRLETENADLRLQFAALQRNAATPANVARQIIEALDEALLQFYGNAGARLYPAGVNDLTIATRRIEAGATVERVTDVLRG